MEQLAATEDIVITEENFSEHFRDVRVSVLEKGEIIAQYSATADFVEGNEKRQIIALLTSTENKMEATAQVMRKLMLASEVDSYRVPRMMAEDLLSGMSEDEVAAKPYRYTLEMFFYARPEVVPKDDPHWSSISVVSIDDFVSDGGRIESKVFAPEYSGEEPSEAADD